MADFAKCRDVECPARYSCYRFMAQVSESQVYADFERHHAESKCGQYWEVPGKGAK